MRNLKVGAKIMLGYGLIIFLILLIAATVTIANTDTSNAVENMRKTSELQTRSKEITNVFLSARSEARELYISQNYKIYETLISVIAQEKQLLMTLLGDLKADPLLSDYVADVSTSATGVKVWKENIEAVNETGMRLNSLVASSVDTTAALTNAANSAYENQLQLLRTEAETETTTENKIRRSDRLDATVNFTEGIYAIVLDSRYMFDTHDVSRYDKNLADIDQMIVDLQAYIDGAKNQSTKDAAQRTVDKLLPFREAIVTYQSVRQENLAAIETAKVQGDTTFTVMESMSKKLDVALHAVIANTEAAAKKSLYISLSITAMAIVFAVIIGIVVMNMITKPINRMRASLVQIGTTGNVTLPPDMLSQARLDATARDEIGNCVAAYLQVTDHLNQISQEINRVANGDLNLTVTQLSPDDSIGCAVGKMVDSLNDMFGEISTATVQVSQSSSQIAGGAQALAQGSTQQAAAVEELSSSIHQVADATKENANMAGKAAVLAKNIKNSAEQGSKQMASMMQAVKEINDASKSINNVIKVIDDIAFQTNILALNAAVEAARAGQHGKGFAVVAEEVRNLAAKSADAAKSTGTLIANSMEKAELGAKIAGETSVSLEQIVKGINESSIIVSQIADSSIQQSESVSQINKGIGQVAQVVQQNSATAEESAASAEEMSSQSALLEELMRRFQLKPPDHTPMLNATIDMPLLDGEFDQR